MNHSYVDPGLRCIGQSFVVPVSSTGQALAQPTAPAEPRECSFNHPSSRQHLKVVAVPGQSHLDKYKIISSKMWSFFSEGVTSWTIHP